jgi:hypothetical protein
MSSRSHGRTTPVIGWRDGIPIIAATRTGDQLRFFCSHCNETHVHGGGNGYRLARCRASTSPLRKTGYVLHGYPPDLTPRAA